MIQAHSSALLFLHVLLQEPERTWCLCISNLTVGFCLSCLMPALCAFVLPTFTAVSVILNCLSLLFVHLLYPFIPAPALPFISPCLTVFPSFSVLPSVSPAAHGTVLHVWAADGETAAICQSSLVHCVQWSTKQSLGEAALKSSALLSSILCVSLQISLSILPGHPRCFPARLSGRHTHRGLRQPPPPPATGWVCVFSFISPHHSS